MARTVRDSKLETRAARDRLKPGKKPHWKTLVPGKLHMGYRRKHKDQPGKWLIRIYVGEERYRVVPLGLADDFQEGEGYLSFADAQKAAHAHKPQDEDRPRGALTVEDAITDYVTWLRANRATGADAERRAKALILPTLGKVKVTDLTTLRINRWLEALATSPARVRTKKGKAQKFKAAPATKDEQRARRANANRVLTTLKAALNRAFEAGQIDDDTAWRRVRALEKTHAARPGFLTIPEAKRLINAADGKSGFRDLVQAALVTGARYGELCALKVRDFHHGKIAILHSKSGKPRDVALNEEGVEFFEALTAGRDPEEIMLRRYDATWGKGHQGRPMRDACKVAKISPPIGFHQLRHSWASHAVMNGMQLLLVARNLGHSSTLMAERAYAHLTMSFIDEAVRAAAPSFGIVKKTNVRRLR